MTIEEEIKEHESAQDKLWRGLCGCGIPELALKLLHDVLCAIEKGATAERKAEVEALLGPEGGGVFWWYQYFLDDLGLTEHGGSVGYAWLTDHGKKALAYLREYGIDPEMWPQSGSQLVDGEWIPFLEIPRKEGEQC